MDRIALLESLKNLSEAQLKEVLYLAGFDDRYLATKASHMEHVIEVARAAEGDEPLRNHLREAMVRLRAQRPAESLREWQESRLRHFRQVRVLGPLGQLPLELDRIYVPLQLHPMHDDDAAPPRDERQREPEESRQLSLQEALGVLKRRPQLAGLALIGDPGAGKTTLLRQLYCQTLEAGHVTGLDEPFVPVFLSFKNLDVQHLKPRGLRDAIEAEAERDGYPGAAAGLFADNPRLLVLLDGLDEVASEERRVRVCQWLDNEVNEWGPALRFVVTCRLAAWRRSQEGESPGERRLSYRFLAADVLALDATAIESFVHKWFPAALQLLKPGASDDEIANEALLKAASLLAILRDPKRQQDQRLRALMTNPLLLSTLCLVYCGHNDLPARRSELFDWCLKLLIEVRQRERDRDLPPLRDAAVRQVLQPLAWSMQARGEAALERDEMAGRVEAWLPNATGLAGLEPARFVAIAHEHCGVLSEADIGRLGFFHPSFREYLAARHAIQEGAMAELARHAGEDWWREVILLALSEGGALGGFAEALLADGTLHRHEALLREVFAEAPAVKPEPFIAAVRRAAGFRSARGPFGWLLRVALRLGGAAVPNADTLLAILRLFETRGLPARFEPAVTGLVGHPDMSVRALAKQALRKAAAVGRTGVSAAEPGDLWTELTTGITFVWVPASEFLMGGAPGRRVQVTQGFWIGQHPVTNEVYGRFLVAAKYREPGYWRNSRFNKPQQPVVGVDFNDALAFCAWATTAAALDGDRVVDLPTEAEWEYTARAADGGGRLRTYAWGEAAPTSKHAVFGGSRTLRTRAPAVVGGRPAGATPLGVHDMSGNVWEWCLDAWRDEVPGGTDPIVEAPPDRAAPRVVRGGSWNCHPLHLRAAYRLRFAPGLRDDYLGIRVVCRGSRQHVDH